MIDPRFAILGALISLGGSVAYAIDTLRGQTHPNRVSWGLWTIAPLIAFAAQLVQGVGLSSLLTLAIGLGPLLVVLASLADAGAYARLTRLDLLCGALSLLALGAWAASGTGNVAIVFSILSDFLGAIPTIRKSYLQPTTESANAFITGAAGAAITILTIKPDALGFASLGFPAYILADGVLISTLILVQRRRRRS